jgi:hypothetical protein
VLRWAAVAALLPGLGFGLPGVFAVGYFAKHDKVWTFLGFPTYGDGLFERIGIRTTLPLLIAFCLVCAAEVAIGVPLWRYRRLGEVLSLWLLPVELVFWLGFVLPFGVVMGLVRFILVLKART